MMWMNVAPDRQRVLSYVLTQLEDTHVAVMMDTGSLSTNTTVTVCMMCIPILVALRVTNRSILHFIFGQLVLHYNPTKFCSKCILGFLLTFGSI